jgi:hypothetical protein
MRSTDRATSRIRLQVRKFADQAARARNEPFEVSEQMFRRDAAGELHPLSPEETTDAPDDSRPQSPR